MKYEIKVFEYIKDALVYPEIINNIQVVKEVEADNVGDADYNYLLLIGPKYLQEIQPLLLLLFKLSKSSQKTQLLR